MLLQQRSAETKLRLEDHLARMEEIWEEKGIDDEEELTQLRETSVEKWWRVRSLSLAFLLRRLWLLYINFERIRSF